MPMACNKTPPSITTGEKSCSNSNYRSICQQLYHNSNKTDKGKKRVILWDIMEKFCGVLVFM